jgi:hypothetical protein
MTSEACCAPYWLVAALNLATSSAGTRPRSVTSMPCALAHSRTSVVFSPLAAPPRPGRRDPRLTRAGGCRRTVLMPGAGSGILKAWRPAGARSSACATADVHYLRTGGARAAAVLAADAAFAHVLAKRTALVPLVLPLLSTRRRWCADPRDARCSSRRPGCPAPTRRTRSGAWPAGTGCPTHCAAPIHSRGQVRPQPPMTERQAD